MPEPEIFDVLLIHSSKDVVEAHEIAAALAKRGLRVSTVSPERIQDSPLSRGRTLGAIAVLLGRDEFATWSTPYLYGVLSQWRKSRNPLVPVLLPGASDPEDAPHSFFDRFAWVDLRDGITHKGLDRLEWGITGTKPGGISASGKRKPADDRQALTPEELLHLAFRLVVARRTGPDLLLHLDAARLREAMEGVLDESSHVASFPQLRLRAVATWLAEQFPGAHPDPLWQNWMLVTQRKTLEDLAAALASPPSSSAPSA